MSDEIEVINMTDAEWDQALASSLGEIGLTWDQLTEQAKTGGFSSLKARQLWLMARPREIDYLTRRDHEVALGWRAALERARAIYRIHQERHPRPLADCIACSIGAALDSTADTAPNPVDYIHITYGPWDSSGHQCGDLTPGGCDEPVPQREVTMHTVNVAQVIGHELGDCPDHPTDTTEETP